MPQSTHHSWVSFAPEGVLTTQGPTYRKWGVLVKTNDVHIHSMEYNAAIKKLGNSLWTYMEQTPAEIDLP